MFQVSLSVLRKGLERLEVSSENAALVRPGHYTWKPKVSIEVYGRGTCFTAQLCLHQSYPNRFDVCLVSCVELTYDGEDVV